MFLPLSLGALIVVVLVAPLYWAAEHPIAAGLIAAGLWFIGFSIHVKAVQRRARRKFDAQYAADEHQKQLIREVIVEAPKPSRFRNF